ncbi:hypothetical protein F5J12DRAFT_786523 [Pisolithus orientalis]|uniref:uncharacterized protein n=1 Tax=Pisolithus orientalis TaxID=936130 RepID=UPI002224DCCE|nr:uncharacterized protein F5J12DRAFT_786523 [Pisolithus orientalis]KAI5990298.1 hypothetical protein F5J12DRAFT_786523 [Pisolithus orientalis]
MHQTRNASSEEYRIISVQHSQYLHDVSVCFPSPPRAIAVISPDNSDVQAPKFTVRKGDGDNTYTMKVNGGDVRGGPGDLIYSFEDGCTEEWVIIFREADRAYTDMTIPSIESKSSDRRAWTAPLGPGLLQRQTIASCSDLTVYKDEVNYIGGFGIHVRGIVVMMVFA